MPQGENASAARGFKHLAEWERLKGFLPARNRIRSEIRKTQQTGDKSSAKTENKNTASAAHGIKQCGKGRNI